MAGPPRPAEAWDVPDDIHDDIRDVVRAECFLLCDAVQVHASKLFILGGGWDRLYFPELPTEYVVSLAVRLVVPWVDTSQRIPLRIEVQDDDGNPVLPEPMHAAVTVGRPPDSTPGQPLALALPVQVRLPVEREGRYTFVLFVREQEVARTGFHAFRGSRPPAHADPADT